MWEYLKIDRNVSEEELNLLGQKGWELVTVVHKDGGLIGYYYIFKRLLLKVC